MSANNPVKTREAEPPRPVTAEAAVAGGRIRYESGVALEAPGARRTELVEAIRLFQTAIQLDRDALDAYAWLAQTLRTLASAIRTTDADRADYVLRCACAVACEGNSRSSPTGVPVRTKQEVKTLMAWLRTTKHLSPPQAEVEMDALRTQHLAEALDGESATERFG